MIHYRDISHSRTALRRQNHPCRNVFQISHRFGDNMLFSLKFLQTSYANFNIEEARACACPLCCFGYASHWRLMVLGCDRPIHNGPTNRSSATKSISEYAAAFFAPQIAGLFLHSQRYPLNSGRAPIARIKILDTVRDWWRWLIKKWTLNKSF